MELLKLFMFYMVLLMQDLDLGDEQKRTLQLNTNVFVCHVDKGQLSWLVFSSA